MPEIAASPCQPKSWDPLGSGFQTNHRESFYQRDLEEKMVHKVTMDTVKIITSSVSGMTNVSVTHTPAASPLCGAAPWVGPLQLTVWLACSLCPGLQGGWGMPRVLRSCFSHSHCLGCLEGPLIFLLPELLFLKIWFQSWVLGGNLVSQRLRQCLAHSGSQYVSIDLEQVMCQFP